MVGDPRTFAQRAEKLIAQRALTNSKRPESFVEGVYPTHVTRAKGCFVWDEHGKRYIDFICALGTNLLGYVHKEVTGAVTEQLNKGTLFSLSSTLEVEFAEAIQSHFPFIEQIKVLKSGSEATSAAIRIARAATRKSLVLKHGYHGWHDWAIILDPPAHGVPGHTCIDVMDLDLGLSLPSSLSNVAAVILEPVITDYSPNRIEFIKELREKTKKAKVPLIFDETITALRFPEMSFSRHIGVYPDLIVMGKALGGGLPISIVGGSKALMSRDYFVSSTFSGDLAAMAAAMKVLPLAKESLGRMWEEALRFKTDFNALGGDLVWLEGYPTRGVLKSKDELTKALFMQEMCQAGVLFGPSFFWCEPHAYETSLVLSLMQNTISRLKLNQIKLLGKLPVKAFSQKQREEKR